MRITIKVAIWAIVTVAVLAMAPAASANSFNLTNNNLGLSGVLGTVTTVQNGSNVDVTIQMSPGYAILVNGGDLGFTTSGGLALTSSSLSGFSVSGMSATLKSNGTIGSFTFDFLFQTSKSGGQQFPTTLSFTVLNANVNQITGLGLHLCVLGEERGCATTGFTMTGKTPLLFLNPALSSWNGSGWYRRCGSSPFPIFSKLSWERAPSLSPGEKRPLRNAALKAG